MNGIYIDFLVILFLVFGSEQEKIRGVYFVFKCLKINKNSIFLLFININLRFLIFGFMLFF